MKPAETINAVIRARIPCVHVRTMEEDRAIQAVCAAISGFDGPTERKLMAWSSASGHSQVVIDKEKSDYSLVTVTNPISMAQLLAKFKDASNTVLMLLDPWNELSQAMNQRALREALADCAGTSRTIVLIGRDWKIPTELQAHIFLCDLELPSFAQLSEFISSLCVLYRDELKAKVTIDESQIPALARACTGLTLTETRAIVALALIQNKGIDNRAVKMAIREKKQIVQRTGMLEYEEPDRGMSEVGGLRNLKTWFSKRANLFSEAAKKRGIKAPRGALFAGVPGSGKTLAARAISSLWNQPLVRLDAGKLFGSLVGESEANLRNALRTAEAVAPCILLIDEIEKGFGTSGGNDGGTTQRVFGALLTWMQDTKSDVFVVGTANYIDRLDPALVRRFDITFGVDLPNKFARAEIASIHLRLAGHKFKLEDYEAFAAVSDGFTGSEIEHAVQSALIDAFEDGDRAPTSKDVIKNLQAIVPISKTMTDQINSIREYCKAGKAIEADKGSIEDDKRQAAKSAALEI